MEFKFDGKGVLFVNANGTDNALTYKNNEELKELTTRVYKKQGLKDITIVDCEDKMIYYVIDDDDYKNVMEIGE